MNRTIVWYITAHGFGHLNRSLAVIDHLAAEFDIHVRTHRSLLPQVRQSSPAGIATGLYDPEEWPVHPAGDSSGIDVERTFERFAQLAKMAQSLIEREAELLGGIRPHLIVSDIAVIPLAAAARLGITALLLANFTWVDILGSYRTHALSARSTICALSQLYGQATALLRAEPAMRMDWFRRTHELGLVCRPARSRRAALRKALGLARGAKLIYVYVGRYGQSDMRWDRLAKLPYHFVAYQTLGGSCDNWHVVDPAQWPASVLIGSVDACLCKAGYSTVADCMRAKVPLIFPPRQGFAEHQVLRKALIHWGAGITISGRDFRELRWARAIEAACSIRPRKPPWPTAGAKKAANLIRAYAKAG